MTWIFTLLLLLSLGDLQRKWRHFKNTVNFSASNHRIRKNFVLTSIGCILPSAHFSFFYCILSNFTRTPSSNVLKNASLGENVCLQPPSWNFSVILHPGRLVLDVENFITTGNKTTWRNSNNAGGQFVSPKTLLLKLCIISRKRRSCVQFLPVSNSHVFASDRKKTVLNKAFILKRSLASFVLLLIIKFHVA